ncbi:MAG: hypothetical protein ACPHCJ_01170, partial [Oceanococcaceae bacterium]
GYVKALSEDAAPAGGALRLDGSRRRVAVVLERSRRASIAELVADLPTPTPLPAPRLDPRLLDQLERYYEAGDMKAVAYAGQPEGDWVWAFAAYAANREEARVHAWRQCEDRRARAQILGKCKIVMEGNRPQLP